MDYADDVRFSEKVIKHVMKRHRDWIGMLGLSSEEEVRDFIVRVLSQPDEMYGDIVGSDVRYFLRRLGNKFLCIVVDDEVVTAYLISLEKHVKCKVTSLLEIDLEKLLLGIEKKYDVKLPRRVIEFYLDVDHDVLFIRFKELGKAEVGEPLQTKAVVTLFTEEETDEITTLEIISVSELLKESSC
jgi:hypothetical protein